MLSIEQRPKLHHFHLFAVFFRTYFFNYNYYKYTHKLKYCSLKNTVIFYKLCLLYITKFTLLGDCSCCVAYCFNICTRRIQTHVGGALKFIPVMCTICNLISNQNVFLQEYISIQICSCRKITRIKEVRRHLISCEQKILN